MHRRHGVLLDGQLCAGTVCAWVRTRRGSVALVLLRTELRSSLHGYGITASRRAISLSSRLSARFARPNARKKYGGLARNINRMRSFLGGLTGLRAKA